MTLGHVFLPPAPAKPEDPNIFGDELPGLSEGRACVAKDEVLGQESDVPLSLANPSASRVVGVVGEEARFEQVFEDLPGLSDGRASIVVDEGQEPDIPFPHANPSASSFLGVVGGEARFVQIANPSEDCFLGVDAAGLARFRQVRRHP